MRRVFIPGILALVVALLNLFALTYVGQAAPSAQDTTATPTATETATPTDTVTVTATVTPTDTVTITPTVTATATLTPTATSTATVTATPTDTDTVTATVTPTDTVTITPTVTATATLTPTATGTPTVTATSTPTVTRTPTTTPSATGSVATYRQYLPLILRAASPTDRGDLTLSGHVYTAAPGPPDPIVGAHVAVVTCNLDVFSTFTDAEGFYSLFVPRAALTDCPQLVLVVSASGYTFYSQAVDVDALFADPAQDFTLSPSVTKTSTPTTTSTLSPTGTPTLTASATAGTPTVTATSASTLTATPGIGTLTVTPTADISTATPTATPASLTLTGRVYDAAGGSSAGIAGAQVAVIVCVPRAFSALTDADGDYTLFVPADYLAGCSQVGVSVIATGYESYSAVVNVADLLADPQRDFALVAATPTPTPTVPLDTTATPTATPTPTALTTTEATPTPTPTPASLTLTGHVYDASVGPSAGIAGATVFITVCVPHYFSGITNTSGDYTLFVPSWYLAGCDQVSLSASAPGYNAYSGVAGVGALLAQPSRDFALLPLTPTPTP